MKEKTGLVLEGGGIRGAYTAGALSWLAEAGVTFDYHVGISTGAAYLALHLSGETEIARQMSTGFAVDPQNVGPRALLKCGHYVDGDRIYRHYLRDQMGYRTRSLRELPFCMETGVYDLEKGETVFYSNQDMDDEMDLIRAGCSLPIASEVVSFKGRKLLDGGITKMIPIERAVEMGCGKCLVITTKPAGFVRKPASRLLANLMGILYRKCPSIKRDYLVRHLNYYDQIGMVDAMVQRGEALKICPSVTVNVNRFKGDPEKCKLLYELGYEDMKERRKEIFDFLGLS